MSQARTEHQTLKLRLSCDTCLAAKTKCDRQRPACGRCASNGRAGGCIYTVSRRAGKPSARDRALAGPSHIERARAHTTTFLMPARQHDNLSNNHDDHASASSDPHWNDVMETTLPMGLSPLPTEQHSTNSGPAEKLNKGILSAADLGSFDDVFPFLDVDDIMMPQPSQANQIIEHDCQYKAYAALTSLSCRARTELRLPELGPPDPTKGRSNVVSPMAMFTCSPDLDKILVTNRTVLATVGGLLDCPCAEDVHLAMLYAAILSKILAWYQTAATVLRSPSPTECPFAVVPTLPVPVPSLSDPKQVSPVSMSIGGFTLEPDDQIKMQRELLLNEVRKVSAVIGKMSVASAQQGTAAMGVASRYALLAATLKTDVQHTIGIIATAA